MATFTRDVCVIGGAGHVGLPLALTLADSGCRTVIYDINAHTLELIRAGTMPFTEEGGPELLARVLTSGKLEIEDAPALLSECKFVVLVIGTPVDEHLNPSFTGIQRAIDSCIDHLRDGQVLILRSTVFPGISEHMQRYLDQKGLDIRVAFCPERVTQGYAIEEFSRYPQIVSAFDDVTLQQVKELFAPFSCEFVEMTPTEAELCKLMTNSWRYIQFATVNQFYVIASQHGLNFDRILHGCRYKYGRMADMPGPGFAAGPCLVKDTMQLAAFSNNHFVIGHAAMLINEGLPAHMVELAKRKLGDLSKRTCGILGMAFKANSDDGRDSLSYKLKKLLTLESKQVLCSDPHVKDASLLPLERVMREADVIFVGAPHDLYRKIVVPPGKDVFDVWGCLRQAEATSMRAVA
jgi:UDP-N-acetyl-D-mannosaminuronic acid dehydrogenase